MKQSAHKRCNPITSTLKIVNYLKYIRCIFIHNKYSPHLITFYIITSFIVAVIVRNVGIKLRYIKRICNDEFVRDIIDGKIKGKRWKGRP